jgi:transposase
MEMREDDRRTLSAEAQFERRKRAVRLHRKGYSIGQVMDIMGMAYNSVRYCIELAQLGGLAALKPKAVGRKVGQKRKLTTQQEQQVQRLICDKRPEQLKMEFALWNRAAVGQLIEQECGIKLPTRSVDNYLARWGFTPQKPIKKAYEQRPEAVKKWLDEQYPEIAKKAKAEQGEIHWLDETAVVNTDVRGRSYAPKGKTPEVFTVGGTRHKLSQIASVNNQGKAHWIVIDKAFDAATLIEFLEGLIKDAGDGGKRKLHVIMDNLRVHHSKIVKAWLLKNADKIEAHYLPSYSPELNPEERLNADLKHRLRSKVPVRTKEKLRAATQAHMQEIKAQPERVMAYFRDPHVKYASNFPRCGARASEMRQLRLDATLARLRPILQPGRQRHQQQDRHTQQCRRGKKVLVAPMVHIAARITGQGFGR